ncbi:uncharacterized protein LOC119616964 isoform X2 [Kryptolebias marmoratus]|uniref:uncharacterized protein LOC119616964 isoform X2 n=1 Tax=Kryptolebias marmoratus TaxID=37003 RepID=UPI0018AD0400|nr:uncharacterized protein LOC119616964 isoform X2 [Kryptolebias marmoratus]
MLHYMLVFMAYHSSRRIPLNQRLKFQVVNAVFIVAVLAPQLFVMGRQPLLNNLAISVALSIVASGFSVIFTLMDLVHQSLWAAYHVFGLLSCAHGLSTAILTLTAAPCQWASIMKGKRATSVILYSYLQAKTTPELYYMSVVLTVASTFSTGFFAVRGGLWLTKSQWMMGTGRAGE